MDIIKIVLLMLVALVVSLAFYFYRPLTLLIAIPLIYAEYKLIELPKIKDEKALRKYLKKTYFENCERIVFSENADVYAFFPSKLEDGYAIVNHEYCVVKSESKAYVYGVYEGIDMVMEEMCKRLRK